VQAGCAARFRRKRRENALLVVQIVENGKMNVTCFMELNFLFSDIYVTHYLGLRKIFLSIEGHKTTDFDGASVSALKCEGPVPRNRAFFAAHSEYGIDGHNSMQISLWKN
jgi:hypothetical protein